MVRAGLAAAICALLTVQAHAETVTVKYRGQVPLDTFDCQDIFHSSFIERVCYDEDEEYMIVQLNGTYYHYCEIDAETVDAFLGAESMGRFYRQHVKTAQQDGPFDCRTHEVPDY